MFKFVLLGTLASSTLFLGCGRNVGPSNAAKTDEKVTLDVAAATPEQALRTFLIAMLLKDEATLRAVTLPTADFDWLLRGEDVPVDQLEEIKTQVAKQSIRALKPGDEISLPNGRKATVQPASVTADDAILLTEGFPLPHSLRRIDGRWRVEAGPVIAARKAAEARE